MDFKSLNERNLQKMQNKNKLISVKEAAEIFINNEFPELDTSCPEYKTALKNAEYKIYKAKDKHNLNVFGSKQILLDRKAKAK